MNWHEDQNASRSVIIVSTSACFTLWHHYLISTQIEDVEDNFQTGIPYLLVIIVKINLFVTRILVKF
jgi:hypothetical protein